MGEKLPPCEALQGVAALVDANVPVVLRFRVPSGPAFSAALLSLSRSSVGPPAACSLKSVRRRTNAGGGVTALDSSLANLEAEGDASPLEGNGKASPVSRRRAPGRALVGDDNPYGPLADMEVLRSDRPSFGVPSLFVFWAGGLRGELTDELKT